MKFTSSNQKNRTKSDSSVPLLGGINISPACQNDRPDRSNDDQTKDYADSVRKLNNKPKISNQKSNNYNDNKPKIENSSKYDKADTNFVNYDEEDQMVICLLFDSAESS